jgi:putative ATP-binding cassette transporter
MAGVLILVFATLALSHRAVMGALRHAGELEAGMREDLRALVLGFKELRLNGARRRAFLAGLHQRANATLAAIAYANRRQTLGFVLQASATLAASGMCIFVVPNLVADVSPVTMIAAAVLMSNISLGLVRDIPLFIRSEAAIGDMERINQALRPANPPLPPPVSMEPPSREAAPLTLATPLTLAPPLTLDGVRYQYPDEDDERGFAFGPVSIDFVPGTISFILGGNSSGKTTLMKLLAGLYRPNLGEIRLGGVALSPPELRENVSAIFTDPYIFDRLYGWPDADPAMVNALLADMGIGSRTSFVDGRFTSIDLSTGQRKRLAWVVAMIEARPILLLDQWAADQDPEFREHFYRVMLPALRAAGRSVIAVTNDDRYYDTADRLIRLDDGLVV